MEPVRLPQPSGVRSDLPLGNPASPCARLSLDLTPCAFDVGGVAAYIGKSLRETGLPPREDIAMRELSSFVQDRGLKRIRIYRPPSTGPELCLPELAQTVLKEMSTAHRIGLLNGIKLAFRNEIEGAEGPHCVDEDEGDSGGGLATEGVDLYIQIVPRTSGPSYFGGIVAVLEENDRSVEGLDSEAGFAGEQVRRGPFQWLADDIQRKFDERLDLMQQNLPEVFRLHTRFLKMWQDTGAVPSKHAVDAFLDLQDCSLDVRRAFKYCLQSSLRSAVQTGIDRWSKVFAFAEDPNSFGGYSATVREGLFSDTSEPQALHALLIDGFRQYVLIHSSYHVAGWLNSQIHIPDKTGPAEGEVVFGSHPQDLPVTSGRSNTLTSRDPAWEVGGFSYRVGRLTRYGFAQLVDTARALWPF